MTRKQLREMGITDEEQITQILNAHRGEIEDTKEALKESPKPPKPESTPAKAQEATPAEPKPVPAEASAPDEVEQLRRELAAEKAKTGQRERRDAILAALAPFKPKDANTVYRLLDEAGITIKDGAVESGLKEQIELMKTAQGYLFADEASPRGGADPRGSSPTGKTMNDILRGV